MTRRKGVGGCFGPRQVRFSGIGRFMGDFDGLKNKANAHPSWEWVLSTSRVGHNICLLTSKMVRRLCFRALVSGKTGENSA